MLAQNIERSMEKLLEEHAAEQIKTVTIRSNNPWFNNKVKELKRRVRRREKIWRKYKEEHQWSALKIAWKEHRSALKRSRIRKISEKVNECKENIKKLCSLVHNITGNVKGNPLPDSISD